MALSDGLAPAMDILGGGVSNLSNYKWVLFGFLIITIILTIVYMVSKNKKKKNQWTHTYKVQRYMQNGGLSDPVFHKARRFPLEHGVEVFELEKPILGSYLIPQPGEYSGNNEFSIILDKYNRIYLNKGVRFNKDTQSIEVSASHAGIDVAMQGHKEKWQQAHKVAKKITTLDMINAGLKALGIVALVIVLIIGIGEWGETQVARADKASQEAEAMRQLATAMETLEGIVNTQQLQITPMLQTLYGKSDLSSEIEKYRALMEEN